MGKPQRAPTTPGNPPGSSEKTEIPFDEQVPLACEAWKVTLERAGLARTLVSEGADTHPLTPSSCSHFLVICW